MVTASVSQAFVAAFCLMLYGVHSQGVGIVDFKPSIYPRGSTVISYHDIGELLGDNTNTADVLACMINKNPCCRTGRIGEWTYNNGTEIGTRGGSGIDYFRSRDDNQRIYLSLRATRMSTVPPTGPFCCELPNNEDMGQNVCVNIVSTQLNIAITTSGTNEVGQSYSLICTPTLYNGETLMSIVWIKDNTEIMTTIIANTLTYHIPLLSTSDIGEYICRVEVEDLTKITSYTLDVLSVSSVAITPSNPTHAAGSASVTLTCTATITGNGAPTFRWSGQMTRGSETGQGSGNMYTNTFSLGRIRQSYEGTYTCIVTHGGLTDMTSTMLTVTVPTISASISESGTPTALRSYTLTCVVSAPASLALSPQSYLWRRNGTTVSGETTGTLDLSPLQLSENNNVYTCQYTATSEYLTNSVTLTSSVHTIRITVLSPTAPTSISAVPQTTSVTLTWTQSSLDVITDYLITYIKTGGCPDTTVERKTAITSPNTITGLQEGIQYRISITARNSAGASSAAATTVTTLPSTPTDAPSITVQSVGATSFTVMWEREPCLSRNGAGRHYNARYNLTGSSNTLGSRNVSVSSTSFTATSLTPRTSYTFEVAFVNEFGSGPYASEAITTFGLPFHGYINTTAYSNNSVVNLDDIGLDPNALFCYTNLTTCCRGIDSSNKMSQGLWLFPNNNEVQSRNGANSTTFSRNRNERALILHRGSSATGPTGIYTCEIPNSDSTDQKVYFGIYSISAGSPTINSLTYNTTSGILTCISTGGPATTVTWSRSGQQSKIVVDTVNATYHNLLTITSSQISDYTGTFSCTVTNSRRSSSITTNTFKSIDLSGNEVIYGPGSSAAVSCFSNLTVESINWTTSSTNVNYMTESVGSQELILIVENITRSIDNTSFTCIIRNRLPGNTITTNMMTFTIITEELKSGPVTNLNISSENDSTIFISWSEPLSPNGIITSYVVTIFDIKNNEEIFNVKTANRNTMSVTRMNLEPGVPYNIGVAAFNAKGLGERTSSTIFTKELLADIPPKDVVVERTSDTTMKVTWMKLNLVQARGFIRNYTVFYTPLSVGRKRQTSDTMTKVVNSDTSSTVVDELDENSEYSVEVAANTGAGIGVQSTAFRVPLHGSNITPGSNITQAPSSDSGLVTGIVVAIVLALVFMVVIIIAVMIFMKLRRRGKSKYDIGRNESVMYSKGSHGKPPVGVTVENASKNGMSANDLDEDNSKLMEEQTYENTVFLVKDRLKPVPLADFGAHVSRMHADRDKWFEMEYNSIHKSAKSDHNIATIPENRARNRFGNIFPYDFNRVVLRTIPDVEHSDYINASYVDGYGRKRVYIAAQGPMESSVEDFWRMIWERRSPTIVMLTKVFEGKKKCEEYWPQSTSDPFVPCSGSPLVIELKSSLPFAEFVVKKMTVSKSDEPDSPDLEVTLFHYLGWPDHGVPANAISMINFIKRVRKSHPYRKEDLMVVHCSAGVGRTGTFITLDYMLERIKTDKSINIYEFVTELRKQRVLMVQTPAQYIFIHNALDELLTCGDTEVAAANMRIVIGKLSRPAEPGASMSGFQKQFMILDKVTKDVCSLDFSQSVNAANTGKNRYEEKIPFNHTRVRLRPAAAQGSDYINASFVEGYRQKGAYIATQGPLPHTVSDFWRMIWEYECRCIVMLCKSEEDGKEVCHRYWPQGKGSSEMYGKLMVSLTEQKNLGEYVMRKLEISEHQPRMSVTPTGFSITQFQYLRWQEEHVPHTTATILEMANLVQKVQMSTGNKPIIVMCNDGVGRSGTFICMHAQMERMKAEAVVDVFQFIKSVRFQRAGLVDNKAQYEFCHQVLADFLDGFDTYANFKDII